MSRLPGRFGRAAVIGTILFALMSMAGCGVESDSGGSGLLGGGASTSDPVSSYEIGMSYDGELTGSNWVPNDGYVVKDVEVIESNFWSEEDGYRQCSLLERVTYENGYLRVTSEVEETFGLEDGVWEPYSSYEVDSTVVEPIAGVSDDMLATHIPLLLEAADEEPKKDYSGNSMYLEGIYKNGFEGEVAKNETTANGGKVHASISATDGLADYRGTLTADFVWDDSSQSWVLDSCEADKSAYEPSYDRLVGTWVGEFESTTRSWWSDASCYGGKNNTPVLTVKSVDPSVGVVTADVSALVHNHDTVENSTESDPGDTYVTKENILFELRNDESWYKIYESDDPCRFILQLKSLDNSLYLQVKTNYVINDISEDTFKLEKQG